MKEKFLVAKRLCAFLLGTTLALSTVPTVTVKADDSDLRMMTQQSSGLVTTQAVTPELAWESYTPFAETDANDGSVVGEYAIYVRNGTFNKNVANGAFMPAESYTTARVPEGLSLKLRKVSAGGLSIVFTGKALQHEAANRVTNVKVTINTAAITANTSRPHPDTASNISISFKNKVVVPVTKFSVSGKITGSDKPTGLAATLQLKNKDGVNVGTPVLANQTGDYIFPTVNVGTGYTIEVSMAGYTTATIPAFNVAANVNNKNLNLIKKVVPVTKFPVLGIITGSDKPNGLAATLQLKNKDGVNVGLPVSANYAGEYIFQSVNVGTGYTIEVKMAGYATATIPAFNVTAEVHDKNLKLIKNAVPVTKFSVSGKITGSDKPAGLAAKLQLKNKLGANVGTVITANAKGEYTIPSVSAATGYTIEVSMAGYVTGKISAFNVNSNVVSKNLVLVKKPLLYTISGQVKGSNKLTGIAATVQLKDKNGVIIAGKKAVANATGKFTIKDVPVGTGYKLYVTMTGYKAGTISSVNVVNANVINKNITLIKQ